MNAPAGRIASTYGRRHPPGSAEMPTVKIRFADRAPCLTTESGERIRGSMRLIPKSRGERRGFLRGVTRGGDLRLRMRITLKWKRRIENSGLLVLVWVWVWVWVRMRGLACDII